ncbi:MAG TPA: 4Fe-4S binding protein, partial [SAR202 cluster bacterium]|nr:4Fe-4S binding protein [SAR202 cluster bacterium]
MYGIGLLKGLGITMKNMVLPGRQFTNHQYPDRKIGLAGLARINGRNPVSFALRQPGSAAKALFGLISVPDRHTQHPRFRGQEFSWYEERCTGCASCAKYCPLGIIRIVTDPSNTNVLEGDKYNIETFDIDMGRCMFCGLCVEACPYDALHMGTGFEEGTYKRSDLVIDIDRLKAAPKH